MRITAAATTDSQGYTLRGFDWTELRTSGLGSLCDEREITEVEWKDLEQSQPLEVLLYHDTWSLLASRLLELGIKPGTEARMFKGPHRHWRLECDGRYAACRKRQISVGVIA